MYPTAIELAEYCVDAKLINGYPVDYTPFELARDAAVATWEDSTGWKQFVAETEDSENVYRHSLGRMLDFRGGYVSVTSVTFDDESAQANEHLDYVLHPHEGTPKRFLMLRRCPSEKITIVGKKGYAVECPKDVRQALLAFGASLVFSQLNQGGILSELKQGDVSMKFAEGSTEKPTSQYQQWTKTFNDCVARYRRGGFW